MRLTAHTDFGLRTLMYLGVADDLVSTADIADAYSISQSHLLKVVQRLAELGLLETVRGRGGGVRLLGTPADINIGDLVADLEDLGVVECLDGERDTCVISGNCRLQRALDAATSAFVEELRAYTLGDLIQQPRLGRLLQIQRRP